MLMRTENEIVYSDVSAKVVRTVSITENSVKVLSGLEGKEGHSNGSQGQFFQPTALCVELSSVFVCDTAGKKIKLIISSDGILSYLEHLEILLKTFGVHRRGEQRPVFTLEEGIVRLRQVNSYFVQRKDAVRAFTGQTKELQGPDRVCSPQTNRDLSVIQRFLERLIKSFDYVNANYAEAFRLSSLTTLYVENFFSEMTPGNGIRTSVLLSIFIVCEGEIEKLHKVRFIYFTSDRHYTKEEGHLSVTELPKFTKPEQNRVITEAQIDELRNWRAEYGQNARQTTVRSQTTKDKPGTLPMICYKFKPDEPHIDLSMSILAT